ncbi:hypothetical protein F511_10106 [Dorcoceras hygrometricum]|uniref:Uncharacterized protein n=1 Tax=Dorcoceras hygrometricum TaxID=472368 RepID=A0A2Z7A4N6_9LAMI|nr:hypothetical protein F511_10106 [Dorcoceras hygrometricum]
MQLAASRRIRAHFNATHHFREACRTAYNERLSQRATAGVGPPAVYDAVVRVHEVLRGSLPRYGRRAPFTPSWNRVERVFLIRRGHRILAPGRDVVCLVLQSVVRIRASDLTAEIVLGEEEFEEIALDVIVGEVLWYMNWDVLSRILFGAVVFGIAAVGNQDRHGYLAKLFALYCVTMAALYLLAVRFRVFFFMV